jgi:hypothetical protein
MRNRETVEPASALDTPAPARLTADLVCGLASAAELLGVPVSCLRRAARRKELQVSFRGGKYFVTGPWLLSWITSGEHEAEARRKRRGGPGVAK